MSHLNTSFFIKVIREREIITKHIGKHAHFLVFVYINLIFFQSQVKIQQIHHL